MEEKQTKKTIGQLGEDLACAYLAKNGYKILTRNYRKPWGEIDIIGRARNGTLVFFEVKALQDYASEGLSPEDNVTAAKLKKLRRTCEMYVAKNQDSVDEKRGWRIDLVAAVMQNAAAPIIRHYENI